MLKKFGGNLKVSVEGYFVERFINLCKIKNIKISNITNKISKIILFDINASDFKNLKEIAKKTKCKIKIIKKRGIYFLSFKYRKRKILFILFLSIIFSVGFINLLVLDIKITGNKNDDYNTVIDTLKKIGIKKGMFKGKVDVNKLQRELRDIYSNYAFIGVSKKGNDINIDFVEKTNIDLNKIPNNLLGNIVAEKEGVISKIIVESGTAKYKIGSFFQKGDILIEGKMYSLVIGEQLVPPRGEIYADTNYTFEKTYKVRQNIKKYQDEINKSISISTKNMQYNLDYLKKDKFYDKIYTKEIFNFLGISISINKFKEYINEDVLYTNEEIYNIAKEEANIYNSTLKKNSKEFNVIDQIESLEYYEDEIKLKIEYVVNEKVGKLKENEI